MYVNGRSIDSSRAPSFGREASFIVHSTPSSPLTHQSANQYPQVIEDRRRVRAIRYEDAKARGVVTYA